MKIKYHQIPLDGDEELWKEHWQGMPEFEHGDLMPLRTIQVHFESQATIDDFALRSGLKIQNTTRSSWFPKADIEPCMSKLWVGPPVDPTYPVYVISKGRWESRLTVRALERIGVPYHVVIEPQEYHSYAAVIEPSRILQLPFSNLGLGSIPARNWVWEHAISTGAERHWILDDNIRGFFRFNHNLKVPCATGAMFKAAEDFVDRYENVAIAGFQYFMFASRKSKAKPYTKNTRIYSCILIKNDLPYRWRGRYNEDTDLSLRALKDNWCTVLFNAFLAYKMPTLTMSGGNTDELYKGDGRLQMAQSLCEQHPDVSRVTWKWGRWQHTVNYTGFEKNQLKLRPDAIFDTGVDNYGMSLHVFRCPNGHELRSVGGEIESKCRACGWEG